MEQHHTEQRNSGTRTLVGLPFHLQHPEHIIRIRTRMLWNVIITIFRRVAWSAAHVKSFVKYKGIDAWSQRHAHNSYVGHIYLQYIQILWGCFADIACHTTSEMALRDMDKSVGIWHQPNTTKREAVSYFLGRALWLVLSGMKAICLSVISLITRHKIFNN